MSTVNWERRGEKSGRLLTVLVLIARLQGDIACGVKRSSLKYVLGVRPIWHQHEAERRQARMKKDEEERRSAAKSVLLKHVLRGQDRKGRRHATHGHSGIGSEAIKPARKSRFVVDP
jgi:hypothetical protein